jgi:hypothetical protein
MSYRSLIESSISGAKVLRCPGGSRAAEQGRGEFREKSSSFPHPVTNGGRAYFSTKSLCLRLDWILFASALHSLYTAPLKLPKLDSPHRLRYGIASKKKSKIMIRTAKNNETRSSYLPISIGWVIKIAATATGFYLWGWDFAWVVLALVFGWPIIKNVVSCLITLACLVGLFYFLFTHIF